MPNAKRAIPPEHMKFLEIALANADVFQGEMFDETFEDMHAFIKSAIAADPSNSLRVTVEDIVESVVREANSSAEFLLTIPFDLVERNLYLAQALAHHENCPVELLEHLAFSPFEGVLELVEKHSNASWIVKDSVSKTKNVLAACVRSVRHESEWKQVLWGWFQLESAAVPQNLLLD